MHQQNAPWLHRWLALIVLSPASAMVFAQAPAAVPAPAAAAAAPTAPAGSSPASDEASSYSIGLVFGSQLRNSGLDRTLLIDAVMRGFKEGLDGKALGPEDRERAAQLMRSGREAAAVRNRAAAHEFLDKNSAAPGVTRTPTGLQYRVFDAGNAKAASPTVADRVTVNYRGRLLDGTEFDNSSNHAQAATFGLNGIIKGWREALLLMKPGAKWRLFVPPDLAYDVASPPNIPPGALLIFDLELLKVEAPSPGPQGPKRPAAKPPARSAPSQ